MPSPIPYSVRGGSQEAAGRPRTQSGTARCAARSACWARTPCQARALERHMQALHLERALPCADGELPAAVSTGQRPARSGPGQTAPLPGTDCPEGPRRGPWAAVTAGDEGPDGM